MISEERKVEKATNPTRLTCLPLCILVATAAAQGQTVNFRSIGTDTGILYSTGTASISSGTSVVTFGGGADLPTNVGAGDKLVVTFTDAIVPEQSVVGGTADTSPVLLPQIQGGSDQAYVLLVSTRNNADVTNVTGGGLTWTERVNVNGQCSGQGGQGISLWTAEGSPSDFQAQITYSAGLPLAAVLTRYSGVASLEDPTGQNSNGEAGACTGGGETKFPGVTLTSTVHGSVHVVGVNPGKRLIQSVSTGYIPVNDYSAGVGQDETQVHVYDRTVSPAGADPFQATLNNTADWAVAGVVLRPASSGSSSTFYVLSRDSATQVTVQETAAITQTNDVFTFERVFNALQDWEDARQGDLVTDDRREVGVCYNDGAFTDPLTISGSTTDATRYMMVTVAESQRHTGIEDTGAIIDACCAATSKDMGQHLILVEDEYTRIEWLQFARVQIGDYSAIYFSDSPSGANGSVSNVMAYDAWFSGTMSGVRVMASNITVRNSMFRSPGHNGVSVNTTGASVTIENCTVYGCSQGVSSGAGTDVSIRNTIAVNNSSNDFQLWAGITSFGFNMYSTTSGFDDSGYTGNQSPPTDLDDLFIVLSGAYDLHLEPVGHEAVNQGDDLSGSFPDDVDAETRSGLEWDIGADEIPPTPRVITWQEVEPQ
jgi:hypothetical protein